jgi:hypothetical protein
MTVGMGVGSETGFMLKGVPIGRKGKRLSQQEHDHMLEFTETPMWEIGHAKEAAIWARDAVLGERWDDAETLFTELIERLDNVQILVGAWAKGYGYMYGRER